MEKVLNDTIVENKPTLEEIKSRVSIDINPLSDLKLNPSVIEKKLYSSDNSLHISYQAFEDINVDFIPTALTEIGTQLTCSKFPDDKVYLLKYHTPGERFFPNGGITAWNNTKKIKFTSYIDAFHIHKTKAVAIIKKLDEDEYSILQPKIKKLKMDTYKKDNLKDELNKKFNININTEDLLNNNKNTKNKKRKKK